MPRGSPFACSKRGSIVVADHRELTTLRRSPRSGARHTVQLVSHPLGQLRIAHRAQEILLVNSGLVASSICEAISAARSARRDQWS
jgi:hypothetical protein